MKIAKSFYLKILLIALIFISYNVKADIKDGKYGAYQVFSGSFTPSLPAAGQQFNVSNFAQPLTSAGGAVTGYNVGSGYIKLFESFHLNIDRKAS